METTQIELSSDLTLNLIDKMGTDLTCVNAARVSLNQHSDELSEKDSGLISFLMKNRHASPFEHCAVSIMVHAPIFVTREWHRHRTQCLAADTPITCIQPDGTPYQRTIEELYRTHHGVEAPERWILNGKNRRGGQARTLVPGTSRYRAINKNSKRSLRVFDEESREFTTGIMDSIWQSGVKELFEVRTSSLNGKERIVRASAEHPFLTKEGWIKVKDLTGNENIVCPGKIRTREAGSQYPPSLRQGIGVWTTMQRTSLIGEGTNCYLCGELFSASDLELDHIVPVYKDILKALDIKNLSPACIPCHRNKTDGEQGYDRKGLLKLGEKSVQLQGKPRLVGEEMTYDIMMQGPNYNYMADYLVVHNSFNEVSGRYTELKPKFYAPDYDRPLIQVGKPGAYKFELPENDESYQTVWRDFRFSCQAAWNTYERLLNDGIAKEVARMVLPLNTYTSWYATGNLRAWINFLSLRAEGQAMYEIRTLAYALESVLYELFPITMEAWNKSGRGAL